MSQSAAAPPATNGNGNGNGNVHFQPGNPAPRSLRNALRDAGRALERTASTSTSASEEDYDDISAAPAAVLVQRNIKASTAAPTSAAATASGRAPLSSTSSFDSVGSAGNHHNGRVAVLAPEETELREVVRRGLQRVKDPAGAGKRRGKFGDLVFTRKFSAFDRQNEDAAKSPFHGFYTLFWIAVSLYMVKIGAENWRKHGSPLGTNEIMGSMFRRDVMVLLVSDGALCLLTGVSWLFQRAILAGYVDWDRSGWILQNIWQTIYIGSFVGWTLIREWPWTHTVFFVLHGLVMLMKQHSYAFYNGHLSSVYKKRAQLLAKLKQLEQKRPIEGPSTTEPSASAISTSHLSTVPSAHQWKERRKSMSHEQATPDVDKIAEAIESGEPLTEEQMQVFEQVMKWEVEALSDELRGKATTASRAYPNNLTVVNHYEFNLLPTLVYELEYPRSNSINWYYVAEKGVACFGVIFVMIMVSQAFIYPVVMQTVHMKETGMPLAERFAAFPWMLAELVFPFMMEYLLSWYLIWETILNFIAELTYFADRSFYDAWWNSVSWDQFARDWNRPVHNFLLRHVYHSSISAMKVNKHTATLITFFLSACVHELVMWCIFKKLRGYLLVLQMFQLPLVRLSRSKWLRHQETLGNAMFWFGIVTGPSVLCSLYLIL